ncbi:hypothetical protein RDI58_013447 [Solanum bulbocastanum]|uniref:Uncharacterized protein n=1 Tax=Solanum bulbocastanum TaxID=147425 RepID=A0AAN8TQR0_SOLBU
MGFTHIIPRTSKSKRPEHPRWHATDLLTPENTKPQTTEHSPEHTERQTPEEGEIINDASMELHIVQASRKQKRSDEDASDLQDQRKPAKRHRVSSSNDVEESRGRSRSERGRYTIIFEEDRIGQFMDYRPHGSMESSRQRRSDDLDDDGHVYHRRNRHYESKIERDRTVDLLKAEKTKSKRDEVEQDYQEKIAYQLAKQEEEEEEVNRIKEESRRHRQAILEKYKNQFPLMEQVTQSGDNDAVHVDQSTEKRAARDNVAPVPIDGPTNGADVHVDELTFSAGKSPLQGSHNADEKKASGAGGLAQGTPEFSTDELVKELSKQIEYFKNQHQQEHKDQVEQQFPIVELVKELAKQIENLQPHQQEYKVKSGRSADMYCNDMFGESPAGIRKMDKEDGLPIECSYLHDNWDDPEGYYSIFSTVVRAKDLKARPSDPEEVAIKLFVIMKQCIKRVWKS